MLRPQRTRRAPQRYWDEYVAQDKWYVQKLLEDVPADELHAAMVDDDLEEDSSDEEEEEDNEEEELSELEAFIEEDKNMTEDTAFDPGILSDASSSSDDKSSKGYDTDDDCNCRNSSTQ